MNDKTFHGDHARALICLLCSYIHHNAWKNLAGQSLGVSLLLDLVPSDVRHPHVLHGHAGVQDVAPEVVDTLLGLPRPQQGLR